jgi:hypothetical protein
VTSGPHRLGAGTNLSLELLSERLRDARAVVNVLRHGPGGTRTMVSARHCLLIALEDYVTALEVRQFPVPHALQRELRLQRDLCE